MTTHTTIEETPVMPTIDTTHTATEDALWAALHATGNTPATAATLATHAAIGTSTARKILARWHTHGTATRHTDPGNPSAATTWTLTPTATGTTHHTKEHENNGDTGEPGIADTPTTDAPTDTTQPGTSDTPKTASPDHPTTLAAETERSAKSEPATPHTERAGSPQQRVATEPVAAEASPVPTATPDNPASRRDTDTAASRPDKLRRGALRGLVEDHLRDHPGQEFSPHQIAKHLDRSSGAVHNALIKLTTAAVATQTCAAPKKFTLSTDNSQR